jgi:4-amino-4-deoxy-L-arabinose transferase-like glycosyltransferase
MGLKEDLHTVAVRRPLTFQVALGAVLLLGMILRLYRLDAQKLWLDELYTMELVRAGPGVIWRTAFVDVIPPLPNMLFWLAGQAGHLSALSIRLVSAIASLVALPLYYGYCTLVADRLTGLLATGLFACAPLAIYYAQEARFYALALLMVPVTLLAYERVRQHGNIAAWGVYTTLAVIAAQFHYVAVILIGAQLLALLILAHDRRPVLLGGSVVILAVAATLGPFLLSVYMAGLVLGGWQRAQTTLSFLPTVQTMVAGDVRIASASVRAIALAAVALGTALAALDRRNWQALLPHALQITLALLVSFVLLPLAGRPAPAYDERVFLLLLPSALFCFSMGVRSLARSWSGRLFATALVIALCATSLAGLSRYFGDFVKSPEGLMADAIGTHARPGEVVLTDGSAYSVAAALRFYYPSLPIYRFSHENAGRWLFMPDTTILMVEEAAQPEVDLGPIAGNRRLWLIQRGTSPQPYVAPLLTRYEVREVYETAPFRAQLLERR